ncbi:MAG: 4-hydroxy-tetrahydrodipicolinate synthase, partial [Acidimicrobiaceae bacterium]|nr:4-hydroxy-tetrahydrodipicolinate synthase [Acidimicrobiaceae bacterium]
GRKVAHETLISLAREVPTIVGVKDAAGNPGESGRLIAEAPPGFDLYSGDDSLTVPLLAVGAAGVISVAAHWAGEEISAMVASFFKGDVDGARRLNARLMESWRFQSGDLTPNPIPSKAMMRALGLPAGQCRLPIGPAPEGLEARALEVLGRLKGGDALAPGLTPAPVPARAPASGDAVGGDAVGHQQGILG